MDKSAMILELRQKTGAGMMDCKKALDEGGSLDGAITVLRKKGQADAAKRSARATKEGCVAFASTSGAGALIELNCETDFVARTDDFKALADSLAGKVASGELKAPEDAAAQLTPAVAKLRENITLRRLERFAPAGAGLTLGYIHTGARVGAMVELSAPTAEAAASPAALELAKELNLQIAGASPRYLNRAAAPAADIEKEKEIYAEVLRKEGKPEASFPKIIEGKLNKLFFQAFCLLDQMWQRDPKIPVAQLVKDASAKAGGPLEVKRFTRYQLGE